MVEPRFHWSLPDTLTPSDPAAAAALGLGLSSRLAGLLAARGATTAEDLVAWFAEPLAGLHDPARLPDAAIVLARMRLARERGERVMVFGDFDADGLTGLAIMTLAARRFGVDVEPYVPSRLDEGHGLSMAALDAAVATGSTLIVTVDCGTTSVAEIAEARARGIDVIVTDHHRVPPVLPDALAIVNPHRPDATYPDRRLAGSGVAFKIAQLLLAAEPGGPEAALDLADLATIGSVADVAPIVGENRAIARLGLERLRRAPRPGIAALLERARIAPAAVDLETVAFAIAPRLNAAGRVGEAFEAARLLLADDPAERRDPRGRPRGRQPDPARPDEDRGGGGPGGRRRWVRATVRATVVRGPWSVGIVGLVGGAPGRGSRAAGGRRRGARRRRSRVVPERRIARPRRRARPSVPTCSSATAGMPARPGSRSGRRAGTRSATGSCDLADAAAPADPRLSITLDLALPAREVDYAPVPRARPARTVAVRAIPIPLVAVLGLTVTRVRAATGGHSQLTLRRERDVLDGIAFGRADIAETVHEGDRLDVVARLTSRTFGGFESLQLEIRDVATSGRHGFGAPPTLEPDGLPVAAGAAS